MVARNLEADPFAKEAVDILDQGRDLAEGDKGNPGVFEEALRHRKLNAIVGFEYDCHGRGGSLQKGDVALRTSDGGVRIFGAAFRTVHDSPLQQV
jgi:hypothetical protein